MCSPAFIRARRCGPPRPLRVVLVSPDPARRTALAATCRAVHVQAQCLERRDLHHALFAGGVEGVGLIVVDAGVAGAAAAGLLASLRRLAPAGRLIVVGEDTRPLRRSLEQLQAHASGSGR